MVATAIKNKKHMPRTTKKYTPRSKLLAKLGHKKVGVSFIFAGLLIGSLSTILFWQHVDALSSKGWTFVGIASQYQMQANGTHEPNDPRITVSVYACKQLATQQHDTNPRYVVKAYAKPLQNTLTTTEIFQSPRLEILAKDTALQRYSTSQPVMQPITNTAIVTAPFTDKSFSEHDVLHYGFNNYYTNTQGGEVTYAFGTVDSLLLCQ